LDKGDERRILLHLRGRPMGERQAGSKRVRLTRSEDMRETADMRPDTPAVAARL
jgi:hypothetical protein